MRKLAIVVALSSTMLATPAFARNGAWYVGGDFGAMIVEDVHFDFGLTPTVPSAAGAQYNLNHDYGIDGALYAGTTSGLQRTTNGSTWTILDNGLSGVLQIEAMASRPGLLVVSAKSGAYTRFYRSTDGGNSFQAANSGLPTSVYCRSLAFHNDSLFAGFDASWPQNDAFTTSLGAVAAPGKECTSCHVKGDAGVLPKIEKKIKGYCGAVMLPAIKFTMPPGAGARPNDKYKEHIKVLTDECKAANTP